MKLTVIVRVINLYAHFDRTSYISSIYFTVTYTSFLLISYRLGLVLAFFSGNNA